MLVMAWSPVRRSNAGIDGVEHPGDYATLNSNQLRDGTARPSAVRCSKLSRSTKCSSAAKSASRIIHPTGFTLPVV